MTKIKFADLGKHIFLSMLMLPSKLALDRDVAKVDLHLLIKPEELCRFGTINSNLASHGSYLG